MEEGQQRAVDDAGGLVVAAEVERAGVDGLEPALEPEVDRREHEMAAIVVDVLVVEVAVAVP
ncbi:MAG: hypothetical protein KC431_16460, partial [Myxococcales bacterium]|nr:hypothetical protein [Myxococcales bacterium]